MTALSVPNVYPLHSHVRNGVLLAALCLVAASGQTTDPASTGCFRDERSDRVLRAMVTSDDITPAVCASHCSDATEDYAFYATQFGKECWCGEAGIDYDRHGPGTCDFECSGDSSLICGGFLAFTLYELESVPLPIDPGTIGCLRDERSDRVLTEMMTSDDMTPTVCESHCSDAIEDYAFYATQFGKECWCGKTGIDYDRHGYGTCNFACSGDSSLICGGFLAFTLYELESVPPSPSPGVIGCLRDERFDRVLTEMMTSDEMTPTVCASHCSDATEDYAFYATQFGKECWCGEAGIDYDRHGPGTCDFACSGDLSLICGGHLAFTLYESEPGPPDADCILEVLDISTLVTEIGGATVTVASNCGIGTTISFDDGSSGPILLAGEALEPLPEGDVGGETIDAAVKFVTPPFVLDVTHGVNVDATLDDGGMITTDIPVSSFTATIEVTPSVSVGGDGSGSIRAVITDPPTDLELMWDPDLLSSDTVDIEVVMVGTEDEDLASAGYLAMAVSNAGSYVVPASDLASMDVPNDSLVLIKILSSASGRRLQEEEPLAFPEVITTTLLEWIASPPSDVSMCGDLFADDDSRCQCFFAIEQARGGVPVTSFASNFRCPATINCALGMPERQYVGTDVSIPRTFVGWFSNTLQGEWANDLACYFSRCTWPNDGRWPEDESAADPTALDLGEPTCYSWSFLPFMCTYHPGAAFCIRTSDAEDPIGNPIDARNQCCYDIAGNLLEDIATGGGTIDRTSAFFGHRAADVIPFDWCCSSGLDSWQCRMYSEMRPTDAGDGHPTCTASDPTGSILTSTVEISVTLPDFPADIDFGLLVDVSASYSDDIGTIKTIAPQLVDGLLDNGAGGERENVRFALGSYSDIPESPFGDEGDYPYRLDKAFTSCAAAPDPEACKEDDRNAWIDGVNTLEAMGGNDSPESQSIALYRACTEWEWGDGIAKILAITTDATFHTPDEDPRYYSLNQIIEQCNANNVKILALKAPGSGTEMDTIANGTGGSVQTTDAVSSDIVDAILEGVADNSFNVVEVQWACRDTFGDAAWQREDSGAVTNVEGGSEVEFTVTVSAPSDLDAGIKCVALIVADEVLVGGREFEITPGGIVDADINP